LASSSGTRAALAFTLGIGKPEKRLRSHKKMVSAMQRLFTLEYWIDDDWYVGKL
jgi:hypothetical protein